MWMHYNGVRTSVPSGAQLGVKGAETLVGLSNVNLDPDTYYNKDIFNIYYAISLNEKILKRNIWTSYCEILG